jgi:hypothetical protein
VSTAELIIIGVLGPIDIAFLVLVWRQRGAIDKMLTTAVNRWLVARHKPEDIGEPGRPKPMCFTCRDPWPCAEWTKLMDEQQMSGKSSD